MPQRQRRRETRRRRTSRSPDPLPVAARFDDLDPNRALALPTGLAVLLGTFSLVPAAQDSVGLIRSFWGASVLLMSAVALVLVSARHRRLAIDIVLRKQHYMQACAQLSVLLYWGWYWREVYDAAYLIAAQLVFAYAVDILLTWSRRDTYTLGFGPFPIIFSINLFLWFRPDWFYLQFAMVALGFGVKELIRWHKAGRRVHIFNPSSFPLSVFAVILFLTGTTHITWGVEIATTQLFPPHIYLVIFAVSLPAQFLFGVASMTLAAVTTAYLFAQVYVTLTDSYFFLVPSVPIAVFLGMHLLFNDPSTSPRSELGRVIFGVLYGLSVVALFALLEQAAAPTFYDKLLAVPLLNLLIQAIDRLARTSPFTRFDPTRLGPSLTPRRRNLAYVAAWGGVFAIMQLQTGSQVALARGDALLSQGYLDQALSQYRAVVRANERYAQAHTGLGFALLTVGRPSEAVAPLRRAAALQPESAQASSNLAFAFLQAGRAREAVAPLRAAIALEPTYAEAHFNLAHALTATGQPRDAVDAFREALRLEPDWPVALRDLARLLATHPDRTVRDPEEAVRMAQRAAALVEQRAADPRFVMNPRDDAVILSTLAASYAAAGRFQEATETAERAKALASPSWPELAAQIESDLARYRARARPS